MSYLDEGPRDGEVVVMVHGNPSWSYYWRTLVAGLSDKYRCIVPDHVGMGLSDKPDDAPSAQPRYDYTLQSRIDDLEALLRHAGVDDATPVTLAVHDWGGMIGFGWGLKDFVFDHHFLARFRADLPDAQVTAFGDAGHYVLEDKHEVLVPAIRAFLDAHPLPTS